MSVENEEIADKFKKSIEILNSGDIDAILADQDVNLIGGFGWRARDWRNGVGDEKGTRMFLEYIEEYYRELNELHTWSKGNTGLAWGVLTENYTMKGQPPEKALIRFTLTMMKDSDGWHDIMYHRDIQPFSENGIYPVELTRIE
jgi:hypothetical protein